MGIIDDTIDAMALKDLEDVKTTTQNIEPKLTEEKISSAIAKLREIEKNNGYLAIANNIGLSISQIKEIDAKRKSKISELTKPVEEPEKEPEEL